MPDGECLVKEFAYTCSGKYKNLRVFIKHRKGQPWLVIYGFDPKTQTRSKKQFLSIKLDEVTRLRHALDAALSLRP